MPRSSVLLALSKSAFEIPIPLLKTHEYWSSDDRMVVAEHVLRTFSRGSLEGRALRPLAWRTFRSGAARLHDCGWNLLSEADRAAVPTAVLLERFKGSYRKQWVVKALVGRGVEAQKRMLVIARRFFKEDGVIRHLAEKCADEALQSMDMEEYLRLLANLGDTWRSRVTRRSRVSRAERRLIRLLATGPWDNADLAAWLARPGDIRVRHALLEACAARGLAPSAWHDTDPAAERYRTLLAAWSGDLEAVSRMRRWLANPEIPRDQRVLMVRALGRHAGIPDMMRLGTDSDVERLWREVLARAPLGAIRTTWTPVKNQWTQDDAAAVMALLPEEVAGRLAQAAFTAWRDQGKATLPVLARAPATAMLPVVLPGLDDLPVDHVLALLNGLDSLSDLVVPVARRLLEHSDVVVRMRAARIAFRITGETVTVQGKDGAPCRVGPNRASGFVKALGVRIKRRGLAAVESALGHKDLRERAAAVEWLSRQGLYLSTP